MKKLLACLLVLCLVLSLAGCSGGDGDISSESPKGNVAEEGDILETFLAEAAGLRYCHGNLSGVTLEVRGDGTWTHTGIGRITEGVIIYSEEDGLNFAVGDGETGVRYGTSPVEGGAVLYQEYRYYLAKDSIDISGLYSGDWYLGGDEESNHYLLEDGGWKYYQTDSYEVKTGYLLWNAAEGTLEAYIYYDEPPFAVFTVNGGTLTSSTGETYELMGGGGGGGDDDDYVDNKERITFITQLYDGKNIVEIPYIEYEGENPEIDSINRLLNQGLQARYEEFLRDKYEHEWIEIKTYPFTTDNYLQMVITNVIYPNYGTEGYIESINYDRINKNFMSIDDALEMIDMTGDEVRDSVASCEIPDSRGETLTDTEIAGFLITDNGGDASVELLLRLTLQNESGDERDALYSYNPYEEDSWYMLTKLSNYCLFDPYNMDEMDPPLFYQQNADPAEHLTADMVFNREWINLETGETIVFSEELFVQFTDAWQSDLEGTYYSFDEAEDPYNIIVYYYGGPSSSVSYCFYPEKQALVHYEFGEITGEWILK